MAICGDPETFMGPDSMALPRVLLSASWLLGNIEDNDALTVKVWSLCQWGEKQEKEKEKRKKKEKRKTGHGVRDLATFG